MDSSPTTIERIVKLLLNILQQGHSEREAKLAENCQPLVVATIVGLIIGLVSAGDHIPDCLVTIVTMVGATATPFLMRIVGGNICADLVHKADNSSKWHTRDVIKFAVARNVVFPLVFLALLLWLRLIPLSA